VLACAVCSQVRECCPLEHPRPRTRTRTRTLAPWLTLPPACGPAGLHGRECALLLNNAHARTRTHPPHTHNSHAHPFRAQTSTPRASTRRAVAREPTPPPPTPPNPHSRTHAPPQVAARRFCLVAAGARQPSPRVMRGFKLTCAPPCLAQTTPSCPRCVPLCFTQTYPLHLRLSHTHPSPLPFARADFGECGEAPVRLSPNPNPSTTPRPTRLSHPFPCLRRMGEISERWLHFNHPPTHPPTSHVC